MNNRQRARYQGCGCRIRMAAPATNYARARLHGLKQYIQRREGAPVLSETEIRQVALRFCPLGTQTSCRATRQDASRWGERRGDCESRSGTRDGAAGRLGVRAQLVDMANISCSHLRHNCEHSGSVAMDLPRAQ